MISIHGHVRTNYLSSHATAKGELEWKSGHLCQRANYILDTSLYIRYKKDTGITADRILQVFIEQVVFSLAFQLD